MSDTTVTAIVFIVSLILTGLMIWLVVREAKLNGDAIFILSPFLIGPPMAFAMLSGLALMLP